MKKRAAHPGEILKDELAEIGVTPTELAWQIDVPANRMSQIINGKRGDDLAGRALPGLVEQGRRLRPLQGFAESGVVLT